MDLTRAPLRLFEADLAARRAERAQRTDPGDMNSIVRAGIASLRSGHSPYHVGVQMSKHSKEAVKALADAKPEHEHAIMNGHYAHQYSQAASDYHDHMDQAHRHWAHQVAMGAPHDRATETNPYPEWQNRLEGLHRRKTKRMFELQRHQTGRNDEEGRQLARHVIADHPHESDKMKLRALADLHGAEHVDTKDGTHRIDVGRLSDRRLSQLGHSIERAFGGGSVERVDGPFRPWHRSDSRAVAFHVKRTNKQG